MLVPNKAVLIFFKLSALAARSVPKDRSDTIALLVKSTPGELQALAELIGEKQGLKDRLLSLRNDVQSLSLITTPTKKAANKLNAQIKTVLQSKKP